jgi:hypothetical protein
VKSACAGSGKTLSAILETPGQREEAARAYRQRRPDRIGVLNDLLAKLDHT